MSDLEYVNKHTLPCGCIYLLAWNEHRVPHPDHDINEPLSAENPRWQETDVERTFRILNSQQEAEDIVDAKRAHDDWADHVVDHGEQPKPRRCSRHAAMPNTTEGYERVCKDQ